MEWIGIGIGIGDLSETNTLRVILDSDKFDKSDTFKSNIFE